MGKFIEFRHYEKQLRDADKIIEMLSFEFECKTGLEIISIIKAIGVLVNPYPSKHPYEKLVKKIDSLLIEKLDSKDYKIWMETLKQSIIINELFESVYSDDNFKELCGLNVHEESEAFIVLVEQLLAAIRNKIQKKENGDSYYFDFELELAIKEFDTKYSENVAKYDRLLYIANIVLKYLLFYKPGSNLAGISHDRIINGKLLEQVSKHIVMSDIADVLHSLKNSWKFNDYRISEKNNVIKAFPFDEKKSLSNNISKSRFDNRKISLNGQALHSGVEINSELKTVLPPTNFISMDEVQAFNGHANYFLTKGMDYSINGVPAKCWVRAYSVIIETANSLIDNRSASKLCIEEWCLVYTEIELKNKFTEFGIPEDYVSKIIKHMTYKRSSVDFMDAPLFKISDKYVIIPSMSSNIDIARVMHSSFKDFDPKGVNFENVVLEILNSNGILAKKLKKRGALNPNEEEREFECDCLFSMGKDLVLVECKAFSQPFTHRSFYEFEKKKEDAVEQLNSIADFYLNNIRYVQDALNLPQLCKPRKVIKIILTTVYLGASEQQRDCFFMDFSTFKGFVERNPPDVSLMYNNQVIRYEINKYPEYKGKITSNKLLNCINRPSGVDLERERSFKQYVKIPIGDKTLINIRWFKKYEWEVPLDEIPEGYIDRIGKVHKFK